MLGRLLRAIGAGAILWGAGSGCGGVPLKPSEPTPKAAKVQEPELRVAQPIAPVVNTPEPDPAPPPVEEPLYVQPSLRLSLDQGRLELGPGIHFIDVELSPGAHHTLGIFGDADALLGLDVLEPLELRGLRSRTPLEEDGILPRMISWIAPSGVHLMRLWVDARSPISLVRDIVMPVSEPPKLPLSKRDPMPDPLPLVGLPAPLSRDDGYLLQSPGRYLFVRADVASALLLAFKKTRIRFKRDPIALGDISQWDGRRPKTDLGQPRHISHEGGRDVDMALPANDLEPSTLRDHCDGVLVEADAKGCAPGTVKGFDALRLAFFLGYLFDMEPEGRIEKVFLDDAYIRELRKAVETLRKHKWVKDVGYESLMSDEIIRKSPWHLDHVHIRFAGPGGVSLW